MSTYIYKPGTRKGPVFLAPDSTDRSQTPTITLSDGQTVTGKYYNTNEGRHQYIFPQNILGQTGAKLNFGGQAVDIADTNTSYEGANITDGWNARAKGSIGAGGSFAGGTFVPGGAMGGGSVLNVAQPFYIGDQFPEFTPVKWNDVEFPDVTTAPYDEVGPIDISKFADDFAKSNRAKYKENFSEAGDFALRALDNELKGLQQFAPGAANLSRDLTAQDNTFNQDQRTTQLDKALPGVRNTLRQQGERAAAYAEGRLPDGMQDRALELGIRSRAADRAGFGGFGSGSAEAAKISDLMSAEERLQIAQYGEQLTTQNIGTRVATELAPTVYANTGAQVKVNPEIGAGRLTYSGAQDLNNATLLSPGQALTGEFQNKANEIQQNQFQTTLENANRQFNATGKFNAAVTNSTNTLAADQFNSTGSFAAALGKFNYDVSYLNALQAANQGVLNSVLNTSIAGINAGNTNAGIAAGQNANTIGSVGQAIGAVSGAIGGVANILGASGSTSVSPNSSAPTPSAPSNNVSDSGGVSSGSSNIDTSPSQNSAPANTAPVISGDIGDGGGNVPYLNAPSDSSIPSALKFAPTAIPSGYTPVAGNADGTVSAVSNEAYRPSIEQFARFARVASSEVDVGSIASANRALSDSAALSYVPVAGFQPIALTATGKEVFSLPAAANNGDVSMGAKSLDTVAKTMTQLGVADPTTIETLDQLAGIASNPQVQAQFDAIRNKIGPEKFGDILAKRLKEVGGVDVKTKEGQQVLAGVQQIAELWPNLSPAQKSLALTSLASPLVTGKTGKNPADRVIPGTERAIAGPLRVKDVIAVTEGGGNGFGIARNYNDIAAITNIVAGTRDAKATAEVASKIGLAGFGPSGSAVPLEPQYLSKVGATPAPAFGVGAAKFSSPKTVPSSYEIITSTDDGHTIAVPKNLKSTTPFSKNSVQPLVYKKGQEIEAGKHPAQKLWGKSPSGKVVRNSIGGSAVVSGLEVMRTTNPTMFSAVAAHTLFNNLIEA